ncbi:MAG: protein tyrosine phosphatase family protein [Anaerolineae bacterium]|uniref:protein tyrosine phosphatase family protein n=1 Tax=Promineifilum sp. TaxID=2664178 RepID=UPI001DCED119|nr:protein tyrosine phosphatase family protein [Anaerolineales bacterium]MCB8934478.1 protein tyrosine phosphatase family protein [Promineifilum sp.]MCO5179952.1 protein tyrosine phosphatase family protein [Promineifilum sp.]MCW5847112.1 protein tyrosine phosphatase family protein [Anaerolineae bacterium]
MFNYVKVNDRLSTAGQPTEDQLRALAADGFTAIINLAPVNPPYTPADEAGLVQSLGMAYHYIPVQWNNPTDADFAAFEAAMQATAGDTLLIHCAANFRVTAFYSLYARKHLGWTKEQGEAFRAQIWAGSDYPIWEEFIARQ